MYNGIMTKKILIIGGFIILLLVSLVYIYPRLTQPPKPTELGDVAITLERTACFGQCPAYKLTIFGEGKVVYEGTSFVNATGTQASQISQDKIKELVGEFYQIGYFALKDKYDAPITDLPTTITSITLGGRTKKVVNYHGAPKKLVELENKIDKITDSKKWVEGE